MAREELEKAAGDPLIFFLGVFSYLPALWRTIYLFGLDVPPDPVDIKKE